MTLRQFLMVASAAEPHTEPEFSLAFLTVDDHNRVVAGTYGRVGLPQLNRFVVSLQESIAEERKKKDTK